MNQIKIFLSIFICVIGSVLAEPLPSWNEGPAKSNILQFIKESTDKGNPKCIPIEERIAAFDEDGTLWVEQPVYTQFIFALDMIKAKAAANPQWKETEPFKSILNSDLLSLENFSMEDIVKIIDATHSGMDLDAFHAEVANWVSKALHPHFNRPYTELVYQPMLEVMQLLREHDFKIYIVSGGGQEFMRAFAQKLYGIPPEHVIGSAAKTQYAYNNAKPVLTKIPQILFIDDKAGKPEAINLMIGRKPVIAFGNSTGDQQLLEWTQSVKRLNLELLVHHDDAEREYAYGPNSKVGTFSTALMEQAEKQKWTVISMKNDWKTIFSWQQAK